MPELPEVQTVVNTISPKALSASIVAVEVVRPDFIQPADTPFASCLLGRRITRIHRRGKRIIFTLDDDMRFLIHLGMTGRLTVHPVVSGETRLPHTHVVLRIKRSTQLWEIRLSDPRRFGEVRWLGKLPCDSGLGIEPLEMTPRTLLPLLDSTRPIKSLLLDQSRLAGLGNIYADESLFLAKIHPLTPAQTLDRLQAAKLCRSIKRVLRKALLHHGSTLRDYVDAEGGKGAFQKLHNVYARDGQPCRVCKSLIQRIVLAGRSTCFCPRCQPRMHSFLPIS